MHPVLALQSQAGNLAATFYVQRLVASILDRAHDALASWDLEAMKAINRQCRAMLARTPSNPDAPLALATIRHGVMERIAAWRDMMTLGMEAMGLGGQSGATSGQDQTGVREFYETYLDQYFVGPLAVLLEGDPQQRYEHPNHDVQKKVFAAVRLRTSRAALSQIGNRAAAEDEARAKGGVSTGSWCGAFAYVQQTKAGGFDEQWKVAMQGELGIRGALGPKGTKNTWIWVVDDWVPLATYHESTRGSKRVYEEVTPSKPVPDMGIEPGDLVLIDNIFGTNPDHITTAVSFDGRFLRTMGGNQGSADRNDQSGVSRSATRDLYKNPAPNDVTLYGPDGKPLLDSKGQKRVDPKKKKNGRVHGVGRWSIVDYEKHIYRANPVKPTKAPSAKELAAVS